MSTDVRVGANFFNNIAKLPIPFTSDLDNLILTLRNIPFIGGTTNLVAPLDFLLSDVFTDSTRRTGAQRVVLFLTDGRQSVMPYPNVDINETEAILQDRSMQLGVSQDVRIVVIGLGDNLDEAQLRAIATDPDESNYFKFTTFDEAEANIDNITQTLCVPGMLICTGH